MKFNTEQRLAIDTIDNNVCVVAGAGTGKTQILTHRFINILKSAKTDPKEVISSIIAITFTKRATREMIDRIGMEIEKLSEENERFHGLINYLPFTNISTIDSFCKKIIDENSFIIGLPSDYEIIDDYKANKILEVVVSEVLTAYASEPILAELLIKNRYVREAYLAGDLIEVFKKIQQKNYSPDKILCKFPSADNSENDISLLISQLDETFTFWRKEKLISARSGFVKEIDKGLFDELEKSKDSEFIVKKLTKIKEGVENASKLENELKEEIYNLIDNFLKFYEKDNYKFYKLINNLLVDVDKKYRKVKLESGRLEFNDLLYYTRQIFENEEILNNYREKYKYIMIDEFQDTNALQRDIFYMLASNDKLLGRKNLFVVGDPKQSIYGFRGSDFKVFEETLNDISESGGLVVELKENYRSSEELVGYANLLFTRIMGNKYIPLKANPEITQVPNKKVKYFEIDSDQMSEAELVAREIIRLKNEGKEYNDIAVLFRSSSNIKVLEEALNTYNIPFINPKSKEFYNKREIKDIILFLRVLNAKEDSLSLYGLLRSNFFLVDDNELYKLTRIPGDNLYEKLIKYNGSNKAIIKAGEILGKILLKRNQMSIYELLNEFITETRYYEILTLISNTHQRVENVRKFEEITLEFARNESPYINEFLDYVISQVGTDTEEALVEGDNNSINLMTIHGSKGLEFPIIIFYDSKNTHSYKSRKIEIHDKLGYGISLDENNALYRLVRRANSLEDLEERDRLLYVCVTRAKEEFIFIKSRGKIKNSFLDRMLSLDGYNYKVEAKIPEIECFVTERHRLTTDESLLNNKIGIIRESKKPTSSITAYMIFKRCPREYFLSYKSGIRNLDIGSDIEHNDDLSANKYLDMDAAEYGVMLHKLIESYNEKLNIDEQIENLFIETSFQDKSNVRKIAKRHFENYLSKKLVGESLYEFDFIYGLNYGNLVGSVDQVVFCEDGFSIVDFKTNNIYDIGKLIEKYTPQLRLYSLALKEIFGLKPKKTLIHFLENNYFHEVIWNQYENQKLLEDLNIFLRFILDFDRIDKYEYSKDCYKYCKYYEICNKERNGI